MYQKPMELQVPDRLEPKIIIENNVTAKKRLLTILFFPATLAFCFLYLIFSQETNYGPISLKDILGFLILFSPLIGPFVFLVPYEMWKDLETKVILTNVKIIRKQPRGKEFHMSWSDIKRITIRANKNKTSIHLRFTRKKQSFLSNRYNHIDCPPLLFRKDYLSWDAANFVLRKIDSYKIPIKGDRALLEVIATKT